MKVSHKTLLSKLQTPLSGMSVIKIVGSEPVALWVNDPSQSKSKIIRLADSLHVIHLAPGDVAVQGKYLRSRKLYNVFSFDELTPCKIVRLEKSNNFTTLYEVPEGLSRVNIDVSFTGLANHLLAAPNDLDHLRGIHCHSELIINGSYMHLEDRPKTKDIIGKALRTVGIVSTIKGIDEVYFQYNQFLGKFDFVVLGSSDELLNSEVKITKGVSVNCKNNGRTLEVMLDLEVLGFSKYIKDNFFLEKKPEKGTTVGTTA